MSSDTDKLYYKTAGDLSALLDKGAISSVELMSSVIERTNEVEPRVNAFISRDEKDALEQAKASDKRRASGDSRGPLDGMPVGIKDILAVKGQPLTCASGMLKKFVSPYDATSIENLKSSGAILWGRLNMDEFAMGSSTENSSVGVTSNPWDLECIPGGSSGGSAACVAAGEAPLALGTDTGGSIRQPAALCGVVGMKPTYGLVSRYGLVAYASSLDQVGPIAFNVEDAVMLLQAVAGHDVRDSTSYKIDIPDYRKEIKENKGPWKLGIPKEFFGEGLDDEIRRKIDDVIEFYKSEGSEVVEVSLPHTDLSLPVYYIVATAEASSNLARYDGIRYSHRSEEAKDAVDIYFKSRSEGFGQEVKRRIILGSYVLSSGYYDAYYLKAQKVRTLIRQDFMNVFEGVDAVITPTSPTAAFKQGEKTSDPLAMYLSDIYTISTNLAGLPGISVPCGFTKAGLPAAFQIIGKPFEEASMCAVANAFDSVHRYGEKHPEL